jgi:hypothetical protein
VTATALWALDIPGMKSDPVKPEPPAAAVQPQAKPQAAQPKVDTETVGAMAERFDMAVIKAPAKTPPAEKAIVDTTPPPTPEWAYLGCIREATRNVAMISVDGHQKFLAEGRTFGSTKLVSVADDKINVEVEGRPQTIQRAERDPSKSVAWVRNMAANAPPPNAGAVPGMPNIAGGQLSPEIRDRLAARGINPDQAAQWQRNRDRRNGNGGNGGPGGRGPGGGGGPGMRGGVGADGDVGIKSGRPRATAEDAAASGTDSDKAVKN